MNAAVQLLTSIIALLTPLPYFRPVLMTIAERVLDAGEVYSNYVSRLSARECRINILTSLLSSLAALSTRPFLKKRPRSAWYGLDNSSRLR